ALAIEPDNARWLYHVAHVRHALGDDAAALEAIDRSIELEPGYPASYRRRAQWRLESDDATAAEQDFRRAIRMAPQDPSGHYGLARALTAQGRGEEAHAVLAERGLTSGEPPSGEDPWTDRDISRFRLDFNAYLGYVEALMAVGDYEHALREFEALLQSRPEDARLLLQTGRTYLALKQEDRALETLEKGIELHPEDPLLLAEAAAVHRALDRPEQALELLDRAIELSPGDGLIHARRAAILQALERYPEAAESYRQALTQRPQDARVMLLYGDCLSRMQLFGEAASVFRHALTIDESNAELHARLGVMLYRLGRRADAEAALARALEIEPGNAQWAEWLAEWRTVGAS
ncbi:MAG: tetratricopeptide repeat protein, partial [Acidobacteria bacterium]|nr:tetratricopeptide repeat protein [Acidobacteriota bacterium]NIO59590.1 tetratricopeptide repeat protein [Acidobacteriota bacterium]NIQ30613.1 tetratricopeptide repeat protein [Acidobacteriota bacterium]NIT11296.1 tetratricopeptide repeat protein [Acidobacteriota bacterium]